MPNYKSSGIYYDTRARDCSISSPSSPSVATACQPNPGADFPRTREKQSVNIAEHDHTNEKIFHPGFCMDAYIGTRLDLLRNSSASSNRLGYPQEQILENSQAYQSLENIKTNHLIQPQPPVALQWRAYIARIDKPGKTFKTRSSDSEKISYSTECQWCDYPCFIWSSDVVSICLPTASEVVYLSSIGSLTRKMIKPRTCRSHR